MAIDIDHLTEAELIDLNRRIVERLRVLHQLQAHVTMLKFSIGDRVTFATDEGRIVVGMLVRYNRKTVSVLTDEGRRWNVSPHFLRPLEPRDITPATDHLPAKK
ncbi:MAG: hypothetical protein H6974_12265 [Gammaproteobacteria bacterium]|nr:hypothetical protein [Gammaproteobacteria bacterium]